MENLQACRVCLATNVKLYDMYKYKLKNVFEAITGIQVLSSECYPKHLCIYCSMLLIKCGTFRDKCRRSQEVMEFAEMKNKFLTSPEIHSLAVSNNLKLTYSISTPEITSVSTYIKTEVLDEDIIVKEELLDESDEEPLANKVKKRELSIDEEDPCSQDDVDFKGYDVHVTLMEEENDMELPVNEIEPSGVPYESYDIPSNSHPGHRRSHEMETSFEWTTDQHTHEVDEFNDSESGIHLNPSEITSELDVFDHFVDKDFVSMIVYMTNKFHSTFLLSVDLPMHSRLKAWHDTTVPEMYIFFAVIMLMTRNRHLSIEEHWSTDKLLQSPIFSKLMSRNRFGMILGMLNFSEQNEETTILSKIEKCVNHARYKFKNIITPYKNICIDESIVPFNGRFSLKQYLPEKGNRFGVKLFVLWDVYTGAIVDFIVYCGASTELIDPCNLGVGGAVAATLVSPFLGSNRHLYIDDWYTSPLLFKYLYDNNIYACGTVHKHRNNMPKLNKALQLYEMETQYSGPLMALKWNYKKYIYMLSTIHDNYMEPSTLKVRNKVSPVLKPKAFLDYSKNMESVNIADMLISSLQCLRKDTKWYKKLFFNILDMHLLNAFLCFRHIKNKPNLKFANFQLCVIEQIIERYLSTSVLERPVPVKRKSVMVVPSNPQDHMPNRMGKYQRCKQCSINKERKSTRLKCNTCNVYLCAAPCFEIYHSV